MEVEQNMLKKKDKDLNGDEISISPTKQQNNGVNNSCTKTHTWSTFAEELEDSKMRFIHSYKFFTCNYRLHRSTIRLDEPKVKAYLAVFSGVVKQALKTAFIKGHNGVQPPNQSTTKHTRRTHQ